MIQVDASDRGKLRLPWKGLLANKGHEFWVKATGRRIDGQGMIAADPEFVAEGFGSLQGATFDQYNYPQVWVESRQIPRAIHNRIPKAGARVLDLGCGPGTSTRFLCYFARPDWVITGFDFTPHFIDSARARAEAGSFRNKHQENIHPHFECQSIAEPLRCGDAPVEDQSVNMALSGGVVGLYLDAAQAEALVQELKRVIKPGGYIALDAGPSNPAPSLRAMAKSAGFAYRGMAKSFVIEPRPKLVFQR